MPGGHIASNPVVYDVRGCGVVYGVMWGGMGVGWGGVGGMVGVWWAG